MIKFRWFLLTTALVQFLTISNGVLLAQSNSPAKAIYTKLKKVERKLNRIQKFQKTAAKNSAKNSGSQIPVGIYMLLFAMMGLSGAAFYRSWRNSKALELFMQHDFQVNPPGAPDQARMPQFQNHNPSGLNQVPVAGDNTYGMLTQVQNRMKELEAHTNKISSMLTEQQHEAQNMANFR